MALPALTPDSPTATTAAVSRYFIVVLHYAIVSRLSA
jgi:hypothetical protein